VSTLTRMMKDKIKVLKADGQESEDLSASVQSKGIYLMSSAVLIEPNDLIQRKMSNGGTETFQVIDPGFQEAIGRNMPAHYQMKVKKLGLPETEQAINSITYNLNGNNTRVNNQSTDNSTNVVNNNNDIAEHISLLRDEIKRLVEATAEQNEAMEIVDAIEDQFESASPSKVVLNTLFNALPSAGSIASIASFLLSCVGG
jgi:hypothetical protein